MQYSYNWTLKNADFKKNQGKIFSCFASGGGSSLGYKLAGFDVVGFNEIDPKVAHDYVLNNNPKYSFIEGIQTFKDKIDLPDELFNLDILDGSPPCSSFSMSGNREKDWGKEKKFTEGQSEQVLDTLFFDFIDLANRLQPKVVIAENVPGILKGKAFEYVKNIYKQFQNAGYQVKHYLLNSADAGVPQSRKRVFFIAIRNDLIDLLPTDNFNLFERFPKLEFNFNQKHIPFSEIKTDTVDYPLTQNFKNRWDNRVEGDDNFSKPTVRMGLKYGYFNHCFQYSNKPAWTLTTRNPHVLFDEPRYYNRKEMISASSFPTDYKFEKSNIKYLTGMSVPPVLMANIAQTINEQILSFIK